MRKRRWLLLVLGVLVVAAVIAFLNREAIIAQLFKPTKSYVQQGASDPDLVQAVVNHLETPWSISLMPEGSLLVTERTGQVRRVGQNGQTYRIEGVRETSEGGLLGIALHPQFEDNNQLYIYFTTEKNGDLLNQIDQYTLADDDMTFERTVLTNIPAASNHNGGAIAFGPDDKLYVTTGDAAQEDLAQDKNSLAGKILRMNDDGSTPSDNPYGNLTWSYGHRNPQGIAWDDTDRLWSVEHGPSGTASGRDELNLIERGANYGWPIITGAETRQDMKSPVAQSGDDETWAPAGLAYHKGALYFAGLRGQSLYKATITGDTVTLKSYLRNDHGRLRAVTASENYLYVSTSNLDGRGTPSGEDDRILRVGYGALRN